MTRLRPIALGTALILACAAAAGAQGTPGVRALVSFTGERFNDDPRLSPNGKFVLQATANELRVYEIATRQSWKLVDAKAGEVAWSPRGDMVTWVRTGDGDAGAYVWAMALDPSTGKARGAPQRVSMGQGVSPAFSLDGRWIAYVAPDSSGPNAAVGGTLPHHLTVVAATGGPERVLAHFETGFGDIFWSADGKSLYLWAPAGRTSATRTSSVVKVRIDGGKPEVVRSANEWLAGMTANRRYLVMVPAKGPIARGDMATIIDTAGTEIGRVQLPIGSITEYEGVNGDSALVWVDVKDRKSLEVRPVAGGAPRRLPVVGESDGAPIWSPDGTRIALQVREGSRTSLAVMNADGTSPRVYRDMDVRPDQWGMRWSPDGRSIAFVSASFHDLILLDVGAMTSRKLVTDTTIRIGKINWTADGRSVRFVAITSPSARTIDEVTLSGTRRQVVDVSTLVPGVLQVFEMIGDAKVFVRSDSGAYLTQLDSKSTRRLAAVPPRTRAFVGATSHDNKWVAAPLLDDGQHHQIELISLENGARRVIEVPFAVEAASYQPVFLPGDRALLALGRAADDTTGFKLYSVPLDEARPSVVASVGKGRADFAVSLSPDGKNVVYTVQGERTTSLLLVDLRPALAAGSSRGTRR